MNDDLSEKLEQIIKDRLEQKEFGFKESYWEELERMRKTAKRRRMVFFIIMPAMLVLVSASAFFMYRQGDHSHKTLVFAQKQPGDMRTVYPATEQDIKALPVSGETPSTAEPAFSDKRTHEEQPLADNYTRVKKSLATVHPKENISHEIQPGQAPGKTSANSMEEQMQEETRYPFTTHARHATTLLIPLKNPAMIPVDLSALCDTCFKGPLLHIRNKRSEAGMLAIEAGLTLFNRSGIAYTAGLRYYKPLSYRFYAGAGLFYTGLAQDLPVRTFYNITYNYGENRQSTTLNTTRLDYIALPVHIGYRVFGEHFINLGASCNYLFSSSASFKMKANEGALPVAKQVNGYPDGLHQYDVMLSIGYGFVSNKRFILSASYSQGITDITSDRTFNSSTVHRNSGFRLLLGYNLCKQ